MTQGERLAAVAMSYVGTPFVAYGREPHVGLDCSGLLVCALKEIDIHLDSPKYIFRKKDVYFELMEKTLSTVFTKIEKTQSLMVGDVLAMRLPAAPSHLAIYVGCNRSVHAVGNSRVLETLMDHGFRGAIVSAWRLPEELT